MPASLDRAHQMTNESVGNCCWGSLAHNSSVASVIIPTFNRAFSVADAVQSVVTQQYRPIELLIVDDGSTDDTAAVVEHLCAEHAGDHELHIEYVRQENAGAAAARNHGLRLSRGEYIQFLDSDDCLEPEKLSRQISQLRQLPDCDAIYGDWLMGASRASARMLTRSPEPDMLVALLRGRWVPCFSYLWRRRAVVATGPWNEGLQVNDDFDYSTRAAAIGTQFHYNSGVTGLYRWHATDRLSRQSASNFAEANFQVLRDVTRILETERQLTCERRNAIADCYWSLCRPCVDFNRELYDQGMQGLWRICPNWRPTRFRENLAMRLFGDVRAAKLEQSVSSISTSLRQKAKRLVGDRLRRQIIQRQNQIVRRQEVRQ